MKITHCCSEFKSDYSEALITNDDKHFYSTIKNFAFQKEIIIKYCPYCGASKEIQ